MIHIPSEWKENLQVVRKQISNRHKKVKLNSMNEQAARHTEGTLTSNAAIVTTLCGEEINLSMLRYLLISSTACFSRSASSALCSDRTSSFRSSPRSGGAIDTVAQAAVEISVQI